MTLDPALFLTVDFPAWAVASLSSAVCALLGNFLVLRRQAMMGDAVTHVVLPGIVVGFLIADAHSAVHMTLGALVATVLAVGLIEALRRFGRLEEGAAMGTVFTVMFAFGIVLIEQTGNANSHISPDHALFGNLEATVWVGPTAWGDLLSADMWALLPPEFATLLWVVPLTGGAVLLFYKELKLATFDPLLSRSLGFAPGALGLGFMVFVAIAAVASFEAVGSILVVAMFICPAATARLLTDRLAVQLWLSVAIAVLAATLGYVLAASAPVWAGTPGALSAAGMIAVAAGGLELAAILFAPRYGLLARRRRAAIARAAAGVSS
ncbi:manganese/zinc/iron transport system permease protein [Rhodothalassium salexigens DSM 2132]|uniref:Manganese/zinc/iron transport system permease protein n=1 Tax=Rhodothalassium salexigens DSM 2132 TaxID=1188247 RepID=A0A4R2PUL3_RHOSA|nr:metal ABC transporter permease [Rhodothalassium salexigens]MBB4210608.1 manganese/zinc/iron transport system permease protein [Rhodothalassium salexigens DSM 2132]MBK1639078.1 zinc ABC transporter permease [Rhodothalassium salexigens DSM 2132]TCP37835.1 manganese/zinc/iron transport system permease protein [Rhodothalassium salexigens DSM 2132]